MLLKSDFNNARPKLIVIVGPNAAGKSSLAVRLAKKFNGEVLSADSRQVYRGLDIGTGKISKREMRGIPHHLLDVAEPRRQFSVAEFQRLAEKAIHEIAGRGKIPILVGGTGLWIDAVAFGIGFPAVPPDRTLRRQLAKKSARDLLTALRRLDPERAKTIEPQNPRRIIRAIEVARAIGRTPKARRRMPYRLLWLGLRPPPGVLARRIQARVRHMIRTGLIAETRALLRGGVRRSRIRELGFEYRAALDCLDGKLHREALARTITRASLAYARRQMAWFRRNPDIHWIRNGREAVTLTREFLPTGRMES